MITFSDREIEDERLELNRRSELHYLGPNLTLRRCQLVIDVPRSALTIDGARLIDCTIDVKTALAEFRWEKARLKGCRFTGLMIGNDFGRWPTAQHPELGGIEDCDFTDASLDGCRFFGCDVSTLRFPSWPCFTVFDPVPRSRELTALPWPGPVGAVFKAIARSPPSLSAVTLSASRLAWETGTSENALYGVLAQLDGVKL
ncbi:hypothetical protein HPC49_16085 [Pyxidicoccus fallax]|uniref:Pentapeptide repeat-containing protein n=1 Tax=Pyxidicoccus fallax TaxID=394095 RepID=A0A848LJK8_9BACT|nr:hypothetical protein [Pyxidicoccus fallax]NMO17903.1 hypothetical protein [Pyxidicoccus fallax]NPC79739.1 hypothetical protein [Pyxidicoccus fallax]